MSMAPLVLGQLVHTSFPIKGFKTLTSKQIPWEIQQAFLDKVVYQYWDSYDPPPAGYRAAYLYQVNSEHTLFGWLYNDGLDDFGRSDVPYFICYYLTGELQPVALENICICLCTGPITLIDRQNPPGDLESLVLPDLWSYQPARTGVKIPEDRLQQSRAALEYGKLLNLFVFTVEENIQDNCISDSDLFSISKQEKIPSVIRNVLSPDKIANPTAFQLNFPVTIQSLEDYQKLLLSKADSINHPPTSTAKNQLSSILLVISSIAWLVALILGVYYFLNFTPLATLVPSAKNSRQTPPNLQLNKNKTPLNKTLIDHTDGVWSVVLSKDGKQLVSGSADKTIKVWNVDTGNVLSTLIGHQDTVRAIALSQDDKTLISGSADKTIKIWDLQTSRLKRTLTTDTVPVWSLALSSDGQTLVSGHEDGTIKIWNYPTGQLLRTIQAHQGRIFSVAMSPDGETFATGGLDKTIRIWKLYTGQQLHAIAQHQDAVRTVIFSPDGKKLASGSWDKTIKIWDVATGQLQQTLTGHTARVTTLAWGFDTQTLISGSIDHSIRIWNIQSSKFLGTLSGHSDWILDIATNQTRQILASSSQDKTIRIWQPQLNVSK